MVKKNFDDSEDRKAQRYLGLFGTLNLLFSNYTKMF